MMPFHTLQNKPVFIFSDKSWLIIGLNSLFAVTPTLNGQLPLWPLALHEAHRIPRNRLTLICLSH